MSACTADSVYFPVTPDSEQTWHDICVRFYLLDSKSSIIDKYGFIAFRKPY